MKTLGIVFSNIYDDALGELTAMRTVASLPFAGRYRQVDFILSNMVNSGIIDIGIITKYNYKSLMDHLRTSQEWDLNRKNGGLLIIPPFSSGSTGVYKGKLEALLVAKSYIQEKTDCDYVIISDSTVLCNIDFRAIVEEHVESGCNLTLIADQGDSVDEKHSLVLCQDEKGTVTELLINHPRQENALAGMGMFVLSRDKLNEIIQDANARGYYHFERDFVQKQFHEGILSLHVHRFDGVVLRNNTIHAYYQNTMRLLEEEVRKGLFLTNAPIYTKVRDEVPTYYGLESKVENCLLADGCVVDGNVINSVIFRNVQIQENTFVLDSIVMQGTVIGEGAHLECVILDKNVRVSPGAVLIGTPLHPVIIKKGETV
ncbi:MAG TPA: glucose-1-phosphate adenylyltransferase subunit GlgD [Clostridiales bacterium]|jgi:glucose-1-phosphate adenylyltransferase|nr:glucose-1-phosphate adenylyltransferase subunit GlgD [Clostridiales bacterium]